MSSASTLTEHSRTITWHDAEDARAMLAGKSGLEVMRGIRDGTLPPPPMARVIGFQCVLAEPGEVAMQLAYDFSLENAIGMLHGGVAASMLDTAMGAAANTMLPTASGAVTLDLSITYLRPATPASSPVTATGRVVNLGRTVAYVTGEVTDAKGRLLAHAVGNFSILGAQSPAKAPA